MSNATVSEIAVPSLGAGSVYAPQADTELLIDALRDLTLSGARVLDLCTGSGVVALHAASRGADVTAVDVSPAAISATRTLSGRFGVPVNALLSGVADYSPDRPFDVVTCNPPYVPTPAGTEDVPPDGVGPVEAWNAGPDGRAVLDVLCARMADLLAPSGTALIVQSGLAGFDRTLLSLRRNGFTTELAVRSTIPFGPVLAARRELLRVAGVIPPHCRHEEIAVIRVDGPEGAR